MRPLFQTDIAYFLERFDHFKESEIRSLEILSPTEVKLTLTAQDKARDFNWVTIELLFLEIIEANLINGPKIAYLDLDDGITLIKENTNYLFCIGNYKTVTSAKDSQLYLISNSIKYREGSF